MLWLETKRRYHTKLPILKNQVWAQNMKRLAVLLKPQNVNDITSLLKEMGLEATIYDVKGIGKDKERVGSGRGSVTVDQTYATRKIVATVVKAGDANEMIERMRKALGGEKAVVMISPVDESEESICLSSLW